MPKYKVRFIRDVIEHDHFERDIVAASVVEAEQIAESMAEEADRSCPDDATSAGDSFCEGWLVDDIVEAS